jgi:hypothetical protein
MNMKLVSMVVGVTGMLALVACGSSGGGNGGGGSGNQGGNGGSGNAGGMGGQPPMGITCASLITSDLSGWPTTETATDFSDPMGYDSWDALNTCACGTGTPCSLVCNDPAHPGFCAGMAPVANGQCVMCLMMAGAQGCGDEYSACEAN